MGYLGPRAAGRSASGADADTVAPRIADTELRVIGTYATELDAIRRAVIDLWAAVRP